jgi:hypothetical protein
MDKKNVQKRKAWIFYGKSLDCEHILKLASYDRKNIFQIVTIKFYYFCEKKLRIFSLGDIWKL